MRLDKFTHCSKCKEAIDLAYVENHHGLTEAFCFECYYNIEKLNKIMSKAGA